MREQNAGHREIVGWPPHSDIVMGRHERVPTSDGSIRGDPPHHCGRGGNGGGLSGGCMTGGSAGRGAAREKRPSMSDTLGSQERVSPGAAADCFACEASGALVAGDSGAAVGVFSWGVGRLLVWVFSSGAAGAGATVVFWAPFEPSPVD